MGVISGFVVISLFITIIYCVGLLSFLSSSSENKCDMTYMFQYPQFVRIRLKEEAQFPRYALYAYSEGSHTHRVRDMKFDGIPVLFIPGNAGSYKQARSLASVALRKASDSRPGFHMDFFTVDLNEELSGLTGLVLTEQLDFVNRSLHRVLSLYDRKQSSSPQSVVLIGHSMGGVIAQAVVSLSANRQPVRLIVTLASPHRRPTLLLDDRMADFYNKLNNVTLSNDTTLITLSGGHDDFLVPTSLTRSSHSTIHASTSFAPLVWVMADHKCIVWCKQLVLTLTRALFDCVDPNTKQISTDATYRRNVFHHHLIHNNGIKMQNVWRYAVPVSMDTPAEWIENINRQYTLNFRNGCKHSEWHMIRIVNKPDHTAVTVLAVNLDTVDWVFACPAIHVKGSSRVCLEGTHLTQTTSIAPSIRYKRRMFETNLHELKGNDTKLTHVVLRVPQDDEPMTVHVDVYNPSARRVSVNLPRWWSFKYNNVVIKETAPHTIRYDIVLPEMTHFISVYELQVVPTRCSSNKHHAVATLHVPWGHYDSHAFITEEDKNPLLLRLLESRPMDDNRTATVKLTLDPTCRYSVTLHHSLTSALGQFARLYSPMLIANVAAVTLLALRGQLVSIGSTKYCQLFHSALSSIVKPYYLITFVKLFSKVVMPEQFPKPDGKILTEEATDFFVLPVVLYLTSVGLLYILSGFVVIALICYESAINKFMLRLLAKATPTWSDWLMRGLHKLPGFVAIFLLFLTVTTCGALTMCLGTIFYFLKLTQMYQDYIEALVIRVLKRLRGSPIQKPPAPPPPVASTKSNLNEKQPKVDKSPGEEPPVIKKEAKPLSPLSGMHFHFTLFILWCIVTAINIPSVLTWAHNFQNGHNKERYGAELRPDPSMLSGLLLNACAIVLWQFDVPLIEKRWYRELGYLIYGLSLCCLIYAPISLYRLNYMISAAFVLITLHQVLAPTKSDAADGVPTIATANEATTMETVKAKWE